jgi:acyl-CoA reductase-like NAD-dependent aldehyde dehydrogenase
MMARAHSLRAVRALSSHLSTHTSHTVCSVKHEGARALLARVDGSIFVDGSYRQAEGAATLAVLSPPDGKQLATIGNASTADVDAAVAAARRCYETSEWSAASSVGIRAQALMTLAALIREPATMEALSILESMDCGKTLVEAEGDIAACASYLEYFAEIAPQALASDELETGSDEPFTAKISKEPVGVVGCVTPWNYPLMQAVLKVAPGACALSPRDTCAIERL